MRGGRNDFALSLRSEPELKLSSSDGIVTLYINGYTLNITSYSSKRAGKKWEKAWESVFLILRFQLKMDELKLTSLYRAAT